LLPFFGYLSKSFGRDFARSLPIEIRQRINYLIIDFDCTIGRNTGSIGKNSPKPTIKKVARYHRKVNCSDSGMIRVLVVEDSADLGYILKTELEWEGYAVDLAEDGPTGIALAQTSPPDVIVSDIKMPGIDGVEFVRRVRQVPGLASVRAIAMTGVEPEPGLQRILQTEFSAHLVKPVEASALLEEIRRLTQKKLQRRAG
jgi:CheY-like chemotaxis protein